MLWCIGSTALVAVIRGTELTVANVGDSRGVLCDMEGKSHPLSYDHKPHEVIFPSHFNQHNITYFTYYSVWRSNSLVTTEHFIQLLLLQFILLSQLHDVNVKFID